MKKIILGVLAAILVVTSLTGCGKTKNYDLKKIDQELANLKSNVFSMHGAQELVEESLLKDMEYVDDIEGVFGLSYDLVIANLIRTNKDKDMYAIIKPADNKKEEVKTKMTKYFNDLISKETNADVKTKLQNRKEAEVDGHLVYIVSKDNASVLSKIESSKEQVFGAMSEVTLEQAKELVGLNPELVDEFLMKMPMMNVKSNMYIIVKAKDGKVEEVKKTLDAYMVKVEDQWKTYLADQYDLVKNRKVETVGNYLIYIVSIDNDAVFKTIEKNQI